MAKVKLDIVWTFWSEVEIDNVDSKEQAKEIFYADMPKYMRKRKRNYDEIEVYNYEYVEENEDDIN